MRKKIDKIVRTPKIIEFGILTEFEYSIAAKIFESDFSDLFWIIENLRGEKLKMKLRRKKYFYLAKYISNDDRSTLTHQHVFEKVMSFIELSIESPSHSLSGNLFAYYTNIKFEDLFKSKMIAKSVIENLLSKNYIVRIGECYDWKNKGRNSGLELAAFFNYLIRTGVLKKKYHSDFETISEIMTQEFNVKKSPRTFFRMNDPIHKQKWKDFKFLNLTGIDI